MPEPKRLNELLGEWMARNWPEPVVRPKQSGKSYHNEPHRLPLADHREHIHVNLQGELIRNPCDICGHARSLHDHTGECPFCLGCDEEPSRHWDHIHPIDPFTFGGPKNDEEKSDD